MDGLAFDRLIVALDTHQPGEGFADGMMGLRLLDLAVDPGRDDLWVRRNALPPLPDTDRYATL